MADYKKLYKELLATLIASPSVTWEKQNAQKNTYYCLHADTLDALIEDEAHRAVLKKP